MENNPDAQGMTQGRQKTELSKITIRQHRSIITAEQCSQSSPSNTKVDEVVSVVEQQGNPKWESSNHKIISTAEQRGLRGVSNENP